MNGAIPPLSQCAFMAWCSVKAQAQLYIYLFKLIIFLGCEWWPCSTRVGDEKRIQNFSRKIPRDEANWETLAKMGEYY
jgi:hypothetical protein